MKDRNEIIRRAMLDKLGYTQELFLPDDILTVARITDEEVQAFGRKLEKEIGRLAGKEE